MAAPILVTEDDVNMDLERSNHHISSTSPKSKVHGNLSSSSSAEKVDESLLTKTQSQTETVTRTSSGNNYYSSDTFTQTVEERQEILEKLGSYGPQFEEEDEDFDYESAIIPDVSAMIVESEDSERSYRSTKIFKLPNKYALFFDTPKMMPRNKSNANEAKYASNLTRITEFTTIQDFWRTWNHMQEHSMGVLSVFRHPVQPLWEDPNCTNGGRWCMSSIAPNQRFVFFTDLVLALLSNSFQGILEGADLDSNDSSKTNTQADTKTVQDEILGVQLKRARKGWGIEIWNKNAKEANDKGHIRKIDLFIREVCGMMDSETFVIEYKSFSGDIIGATYTNSHEKEFKI